MDRCVIGMIVLLFLAPTHQVRANGMVGVGAEVQAVPPCEAARARSSVPLADGWVEVCTGPGGAVDVLARTLSATRTVHYAADRFADHPPAVHDWVVAHERCHTLHYQADGPAGWSDGFDGLPVDVQLAVERATDACAEGFGADITRSGYQP